MAAMTQIRPQLGAGIYRLADVARYTKIHPSTVRSWFKSRDLFQVAYRSRLGVETVSFLDMIDTHVAADLRRHGVSMKVVRRAYESLKSVLHTEHPFCHKHLYTDGRNVITRATEGLRDGNLMEAIGNQLLYEEFGVLLASVSFCENTLLVDKWHIHECVVIDPEISMGHPVIEGTGVSTRVLSGAYHANGQNSAFVASLYNVNEDQVRCAVHFEKKPANRAA